MHAVVYLVPKYVGGRGLTKSRSKLDPNSKAAYCREQGCIPISNRFLQEASARELGAVISVRHTSVKVQRNSVMHVCVYV